jgi:NAD(P)-dependent dehydrogenase (short-subunit alcohol dehydrogenase family)
MYNSEYFRVIVPRPCTLILSHPSANDSVKNYIEDHGMPIASTKDVSDVVLFLASKEARWVTGSVVSTNRGILNL